MGPYRGFRVTSALAVRWRVGGFADGSAGSAEGAQLRIDAGQPLKTLADVFRGRPYWSVTRCVLFLVVAGYALVLMRDPEVRGHLSSLLDPVSEPDTDVEVEAPDVERASSVSVAGSIREPTAPQRAMSGEPPVQAEPVPVAGASVQSPGAPGSTKQARAEAQAPSTDTAGTRPRRRPGSALLRPADFERLIAAVQDEFRLERAATPEAELDILRRAAESGKPDALLGLGLYLAYATEGGGDPVLAADLFHRAHAAGSSRALAELGRLHLTGTGLPLDPERAASFFEQARGEGDTEGVFLLGMANRLELFAGADPVRACELLTEAADRGHVGAQTAAFVLQQDGELDFGGMDRAVGWLEAAAGTGDSGALMHLATFYAKRGRADDAFATLMVAAEAGSQQARERLAMSLVSGRFTPKSLPRAIQLVRELTAVPDLADSRALFMRAYFESVLTRRGMSDSDPLQWLRLAEGQGDHRAKLARIRLERGEDAATVFRETGPLKPEQAYMKVVELDPIYAGAGERPRLPARPIFAPQPPYPAELSATRQPGRVVITFTVDPEGKVVDLKVAEASHPAFAVVALEAVAQWRFTPGRDGDKPVATKMRQALRFAPD